MARLWSPQSPLFVSACIIAAAVLLLLPPDAFSRSDPAFIVWGTAGALLFLALYGFRVATRRAAIPWFSPIYLVTAFYFFKYGWGSLVAYYWGFVPWQALPELSNYFYRLGVWNNLPSTCRLFLLGGLGLFLGLSLPTKPVADRLPRLQWPFSDVKLRHCIVVFTPLALIALWFVRSHLDGVLPFSIVVLASMIDACILLVSYYLFSALRGDVRVRWSCFLALLLLLRLPTALSTGQMVPLLTPGLMALFGYVLARKSPPWMLLLVATPVLLFFVLPFTALYKFAGTETAIQERLLNAQQAFTATSYQTRLELSLARTFARLCGAQFPSVFTQFYPNVYPFEHGETFGIEVTGLVPRVLWPDKPEVSPELNRYSEQVGIIKTESGTSAVFDALSEYYVNFGAIGVFVLFVIHGWYFSVLYEWLVNRGHAVIGIATYMCLVPGNWDFFGLGNCFALHVKAVPVWLLLFYLMSRKPICPSVVR